MQPEQMMFSAELTLVTQMLSAFMVYGAIGALLALTIVGIIAMVDRKSSRPKPTDPQNPS
ncbi:MAG: hypothetical protein AAB692_01275 [Patescibacteria group bacterium]